jgi:RNA polymerase sigma factor (sigma-70 family)
MPKLTQNEFEALFSRVRSGDQQAALELVQLYEPEIRREVRLRLTSSQMRRTLDSLDICQSVFGKFFVKAALGELEFDRPQQLLRLLCQMARNKVIDCHRKERVRRPSSGAVVQALGDRELPERTETPSQVLVRKEMAQKVTDFLTEQENEIASQRRDGRSWPQIAAAMGNSAEALRKILERARDRVITQLGIDD